MMIDFDRTIRDSLHASNATTEGARKEVYGRIRAALQERFSKMSPLPTQEEIVRYYTQLEAAIDRIEKEVKESGGVQRFTAQASPSSAAATGGATHSSAGQAEQKSEPPKRSSDGKPPAVKQKSSGRFRSWLFGVACGVAVVYGYEWWQQRKLDEVARVSNLKQSEAIGKVLDRLDRR